MPGLPDDVCVCVLGAGRQQPQPIKNCIIAHEIAEHVQNLDEPCVRPCPKLNRPILTEEPEKDAECTASAVGIQCLVNAYKDPNSSLKEEDKYDFILNEIQTSQTMAAKSATTTM